MLLVFLAARRVDFIYRDPGIITLVPRDQRRSVRKLIRLAALAEIQELTKASATLRPDTNLK